ncbi:MAG: YhjD/YihY/BrkB family envelope integrity protein [Deferribacterota bacterium]|nr:YhjD/YihY/BrkB family envelope integrity protein [Deferribacterota bacterium]
MLTLFVQLEKIRYYFIKNINIILLTLNNVYEKRLVNHAAALAYYFILSVIPSLILIIILANKILIIYPNITNAVIKYIEGLNPSLSNFINSTNALNTDINGGYSLISLFSLIIAASLFFRALIRCFNIICDNIPKKIITGFFLPYLLTLISTILIIIIILFQLLAQIFIKVFIHIIPFKIPPYFIFLINNFLIPTIVISIATFISYYMLSNKKITIKASLYGSITFSLTLFFTNYLFNTLYNPYIYNYLYGSLTYIIILLIWLYVIFILYLLFADLSYNLSRFDEHIKEIRVKTNPTFLEKIIIKISKNYI